MIKSPTFVTRAFDEAPPIIQGLDAASWKFREAKSHAWHPAKVPGSVHADLFRAGLIPDPFWGRNERELQWIEERDWVYAAEFVLAPELATQKQVDLVAEGLDTIAEVKLNGAVIARVENMFQTYRWRVEKKLRPGKNRIEIRFFSAMDYLRARRQEHRPREINDPVGGCTRIRKQQCSFGWDWGPRLVTCGIWKSLRLEGRSGPRLVDVRLTQRHFARRVRLTLVPEVTGRSSRPRSYQTTVRFNGSVVATTKGLVVDVPNPALWWPSGQGSQPLYDVEMECRQGGQLVERWTRRIGLRQIILQVKPDRFGQSFGFVVNGRAIFAKGANWIPANALQAAVGRSDYEPLLRSAVEANMNMIRVWGGGVYENDSFYDLCDELGLLVWQDFMFACTLYPGDRAFLKSSEAEAVQQVRRLRDHASLALWCGNNEVELLNPDDLRRSKAARRAHDQLFHRLLARVVAREDGVTAYWPSSPSGSQLQNVDKRAEKLTGDWHDWDVWHARHPVKFYERSRARFASEFGMQSFSSPTVAATYCAPADWNIFSPAMENHQKNPAGNGIMLDYVSRRYRFPRDYPALAYLSQLNQAYCMKVAVEHWRRMQDRTRGAVYWQLNDCWPVASWSSLEFGGRWKIAHYAARKFFAPLLVSAHVLGDETAGIGNWLKRDFRGVELFSVYDHPVGARGELTWELWQIDLGRVLRKGRQPVTLRPGKSRRWVKLTFAEELRRHEASQLALRLRLTAAGLPASEDVVLFTAPRHLSLHPVKPSFSIHAAGSGQWRIELSVDAYCHGVWLELPDASMRVSDNGFDLFPGESREIMLRAEGAPTLESLHRLIQVRSLVDSF